MSDESDAAASEMAEMKEERIDYGNLIAYWNEHTGGRWGKLVSIDNQRRKMVRARIAKYGKKRFIEAIEMAVRSDFLAASDWFSFDWMIRPNNFEKLISGNYDTRKHNVRDEWERRVVTKPSGGYTADF